MAESSSTLTNSLGTPTETSAIQVSAAFTPGATTATTTEGVPSTTSSSSSSAEFSTTSSILTRSIETSSSFTSDTTLGVSSTTSSLLASSTSSTSAISTSTTPRSSLTSAESKSTTSSSSATNSTTSGAASAGISKTAHSTGLSAGGTAGVSIATFLIGLALAGLGVWFFMGRRRKSSRHSDAYEHPGEKRELMDPAPVHEGALLDSVDDSELQNSMMRLNDFIDQHVLSHYHESPTQIPVGQLAQAIAEVKGLNSEGGISADELARLLITPATRFSAIRHFIASVIFSNMRLNTPPNACLLPQFIVAFYNNFPPVERQAGSEAAYESAFTQWKHSSSYLLVPNRTLREGPKLNESEIHQAVEVNLRTLNHILAPFMLKGSKSPDWERNLRGIITSGAELGLTLFSQQNTYVFDWKPHGKDAMGNGGIVVFPGLLEKVKGKTRLRGVSKAVVA